MSINAENYTDAKGIQAHLGFLLLLVLDLLTKETLTNSQSISAIFIAIAIPLFLTTLMILPGEDKISKWQLKMAFVTLPIGHGSGLIAISIILWGFNSLAGVVFFISSLIAFFLFGVMCYRVYGENFIELAEQEICKDENT